MTIVCPKCALQMQISKVGVGVELMTARGEPYQLRSADLWRCGGCGLEIAASVASQPICEAHEPVYLRMVGSFARGGGHIRYWANRGERTLAGVVDSGLPVLRPAADVQQAHDRLVPMILGDVPSAFTAESMPLLRAACDVLCWTLQHSHNTTFEERLAQAEEFLRDKGYALLDSGSLVRPGGEDDGEGPVN